MNSYQGARPMYASQSFSSRSASGIPNRMGSSRGMFGGGSGDGSRISVSTFRGVNNAPLQFGQQNSGMTAMGAGGKETMKDLNNRLDKYLSRVRTLEESNRELEEKIKEELLKRGAVGGRDWSVYDEPLADLRAQIRDMTMGNAQLLLQIDNARLAADDFKVKYESELALRQGVEQDIAGLRKIIDDTNLSRMQLESQIEAAREELAYLKKCHEEELAELRGQITSANVSVELNTPKGPDINEAIAKIRDQYEKAAQKNRDENNAWYQNKFDKLNAEVTHNTEAIQDGRSELNSLQKTRQTLEMELQSLYNMIQSLEDRLAETQNSYADKMNQLNQQLHQLQAQLTDLKEQAARQGEEYRKLLNIKERLEEEIATYQRLLGDEHGGDSSTRPKK